MKNQMQRLPAAVRRVTILDAIIKAIEGEGIHYFTNDHVSELCSIETSVGTIRRFYSTRESMFEDLMEYDQTPKDMKREIERCGYV